MSAPQFHPQSILDRMRDLRHDGSTSARHSSAYSGSGPNPLSSLLLTNTPRTSTMNSSTPQQSSQPFSSYSSQAQHHNNQTQSYLHHQQQQQPSLSFPATGEPHKAYSLQNQSNTGNGNNNLQQYRNDEFASPSELRIDVRSATNGELKEELVKVRREYEELVNRLLRIEQEFRETQEQKYQLVIKVEKLSGENKELKRYSGELLEQRNELLRKMNEEQASKIAEGKNHQNMFQDMEATIRNLTEQNNALVESLSTFPRSAGGAADPGHLASRFKVSLSDSTGEHAASPDAKPYGSGKLMELHEWLTSKEILPKKQDVKPLASSVFRLSDFESPQREPNPNHSHRKGSTSATALNGNESNAQIPLASTAASSSSGGGKNKTAPKRRPASATANAASTVTADRREIGTLRLGSTKDAGSLDKKRNVPLLKIDLASDIPFDHSPPRL
eukprot:ANDGO_02112.mRNA.1 hypothetical protein